MHNHLYNISNKSVSLIKKQSILKIAGLSIAILFSINSDSSIKNKDKNNLLNKNNFSILFEIENKEGFVNKTCSPIDTLGYYYYTNGLYNEALDVYKQKLDSAVISNDKYNQWGAYVEIGLVYRDQGLYDDALKYYKNALSILDTTSTRNFIANIQDISLIYYGKGDIQNYKIYLEKALSILTQSSDKSLLLDEGTFNLYINLCNYYFNHTKDIKKAREYLDKSNNIILKINNDLSKIVYLTREGDFSYKEGKYDDFLKIYFQALELAKQKNNLLYQKVIYFTIVSYYKDNYNKYKNIEDLEKKDYYEDLLNKINSDMYNQQLNKTMAALNVKFEVEKLKAENEKKEVELIIQQQKTKIARTIGGFASALVLVLGGAGIWINKIKKDRTKQRDENARQRDEIKEKNVQLEQYTEELQAINDELSEKNQIITKQRDEIVEQKIVVEKQKLVVEKVNKDMSDSINYASRVQTSILLNDPKKYFPDSFVYNKPRDVVSGDFYFSTENKDGKKMLAVADCTGHGVPGAFLTIFGNTNMKVAIESAEIPSDIINLLDCKFLELYSQEEQKDKRISMHDSMDIACIFYDPKTHIMEYSASSRPILIMRKGELIKLVSDTRVSVGSIEKPKKFEGYKTNEYQLMPDDDVFMFTDGVSDQYVIKSDKKLKSDAFRNLIKDISEIPVVERTSYIEKFYNDIMKKKDGTKGPQTDDMLLVAFKV